MKLRYIEKLPNENSRTYAYRVLKKNIMELFVIPGDSLIESDIANYLNLSRTPVREAFIKLSEEKLLDIYPQKGTYVSLIDTDLVDQALFIREIIEKKIIEIACDDFPLESLKEMKKLFSYQKSILDFSDDSLEFYKLDNNFHKTLFLGCKKEAVWESIETLSTHYNRLRALDALTKENLESILEQHRKIIEIIENKNSQDIGELIAKHLNNHKYIALKEKYPKYFKS